MHACFMVLQRVVSLDIRRPHSKLAVSDAFLVGSFTRGLRLMQDCAHVRMLKPVPAADPVVPGNA
jgi:hypothetical protein